MQDVREIEFRDSGSTHTTRYVSRFEPLLYVPAFTQKNFHNVHVGTFTKRPPPKNYNSTFRVHNSTLSNTNLYTRGGKLAKAKKYLQLGDPMITNSLLVISKDYK